MVYLVRECEFDGLLTDAQHAERRRQLDRTASASPAASS